MKWHLFLTLGGPARAIAGLQPIGEPQWNDGVACYTYLSTYLVAIAAETAEPDFPTLPSFTRGIIPPYFSNRSTSVPPSAVTEASEINEKPATLIDFTTSNFAIPTDEQEDPGTTATDSGQAVIFFVSPQVYNEERDIVKRAPGGFIGGDNTNVDICTNAGTFRLGDGQLFDLQDPIYYDSEPYKEFRGQGTPPADAVTREFSNVAGTLVFSNRTLLNTNVGFCQVEESGQVYITFTSSPPGCVPISLRVYAVEQCQNGQIIGLDPAESATTEPNQSSTIADTLNTASSETVAFPGDPSSTALSSARLENTETTPSSDPTHSFTSSPADQATTVTSDLSFEVSSSIPSFFTSSQSTETPPSFTTSVETPTISESFTSLLSSFTTTASSDSFSSDRTLSSDFFSSTETFAPEPTSTLAIESSTDSEVTSELSSTITDESTATTEESTTTTTEEATTTTTEEPTTATGCNSVDPLTTVALANPTPVFGNAYRDNEFASFQLPWTEGLFGTGQTTVYVNTNGYITLDAGNTNPENSDLPTGSLVNRAFLPYWDDLVYDPSKGHAVVYEIFQSVYGPQLVVEFILGKADSPGVYHFEASFFRDFPQDFRFQYYTTPEKGSSATAGFQNLLTRRYAQGSLNQADVLVDGTAAYLVITVSDYFERVTFDNTECGIGNERVQQG